MLAVHLAKARQPAPPSTRPKPLGWSWVPSLYLHRYLRLTPLYFFVLGMYYYVMRVVDQGPYWGLLERDYDMCVVDQGPYWGLLERDYDTAFLLTPNLQCIRSHRTEEQPGKAK